MKKKKIFSKHEPFRIKMSKIERMCKGHPKIRSSTVIVDL